MQVAVVPILVEQLYQTRHCLKLLSCRTTSIDVMFTKHYSCRIQGTGSCTSLAGPTQNKLTFGTRYNWQNNFSTLSYVNTVSLSPPVLFAQESLLALQEVTGWPWWAVIVVTTMGARSLITLPLTVYQNKVLARYMKIQLELKDVVEELKIETAVAVKRFRWSQAQAKVAFNRSLRKQRQLLIERENCHPFKASIVMWIQLPMWISISFALRNLVSMAPSQDLVSQMAFFALSGGGFLWIPNLTIPDHSLILPFTLGLVNLTIIEMHASKTLMQTKFQKVLSYFMRAVSIALVPLSAAVPSCLSLYWTASSCVGLSHNLLLMSPLVRRWLRIPSIVGESKTPYSDLINNFKIRMKRIIDKLKRTI